MSAPPQLEANKVKYLIVSQSHEDREVGGQTSQVPATLPKEEVMVQATYVRTHGTSTIREKKQLDLGQSAAFERQASFTSLPR